MLTRTVKVRVEVPARVSEAAREHAEMEAQESAVLALWQAGEFSTREAAAELSLTYYDFLELLSTRGLPAENGTSDSEALEQARRQMAEGKA